MFRKIQMFSITKKFAIATCFMLASAGQFDANGSSSNKDVGEADAHQKSSYTDAGGFPEFTHDVLRDNILPLCDAEDVMSLELTCKYTKKACDNSKLWQGFKKELRRMKIAALKNVAIKDLQLSYFPALEEFRKRLLSFYKPNHRYVIKPLQTEDEGKQSDLLKCVFYFYHRFGFSHEDSLYILDDLYKDTEIKKKINLSLCTPHTLGFLEKSESKFSVLDVMNQIHYLGNQRNHVCTAIFSIKDRKIRKELLRRFSLSHEKAEPFCFFVKDFMNNGMQEQIKSFVINDVVNASNGGLGLVFKFKKFYEDLIEFDRKRPDFFYEILKCPFYPKVIIDAFIFAQEFNFESNPMTTGYYVLRLFVMQEREQIMTLTKLLITYDTTTQNVLDILSYLDFIGDKREEICSSVQQERSSSGLTPAEVASKLRGYWKTND